MIAVIAYKGKMDYSKDSTAEEPSTLLNLPCSVCGQSFPQPEFDQHLHGKKHRKKLMDIERRTIQWNNVPGDCTYQSILEYFQNFDEKNEVKYEPDKKKAIIKCVDWKTARILCEMDHDMDGHRFSVHKPGRTKVEKRPRKRERALTNPDQWIDDCISKLHIVKSDEKKFDALMEGVLLSDDEIAARQAVCSQVESAVSKIIAGSRIVPFGSFINGLGMRNGDLDMILELDFELNQAVHFNKQAKGSFAKLLAKLMANPNFARAELEHRTERDVLTLLQCIVQKYIPNVKKLYCLHRATVPILGFTMPGVKDGSDISCDICVNRRLGAENSRLIVFLQSLDPRVRPLLIAVLVWAKKKWPRAVTERPTSYALVMMVITFLQTRPKPVLPPIDLLQKLAKEPKKVGEWFCQFSEDASELPKRENVETKGQLFEGFITFLAELDFERLVMCPLAGRVMFHEEFSGKMPATKDFSFSLVNVQDPFETSRNLTKIIKERGARLMKQTLIIERNKMMGEWSLDTLLAESNEALFNQDRARRKRMKFEGRGDGPPRWIPPFHRYPHY